MSYRTDPGFSWRDVVTAAANLPVSGMDGDFHFALAEETLHYWKAGAWHEFASGGGGGASDWGDLGGDIQDQLDLIALFDLKAPLDSPTFATKTTHSYATASTAATFNASKELVSSSVTTTELALLSGKTSVGDVSGPGSSTDRGIATWNSTGGVTLRSNTPQIDSSGYLLGNSTTFKVFFSTSNDYGIKRAGSDFYFWLNSGIESPQFIISSSGELHLNRNGLMQIGQGTTATVTYKGCDNDSFNDPVHTIFRAGNGAGTRVGGNATFRGGNAAGSGIGGNADLTPGTSASGTPGGCAIGQASIAAAANGGFPYIPTIAGTPSGTPTARTGFVAGPVFEVSTGLMWIYDGSGWVSAAFT